MIGGTIMTVLGAAMLMSSGDNDRLTWGTRAGAALIVIAVGIALIVRAW